MGFVGIVWDGHANYEIPIYVAVMDWNYLEKNNKSKVNKE